MTEEIKVRGEFIIEFRHLQDWVNKCPDYLPRKTEAAETWLWVDKMGNIAAIGEDFQAAAKYATYPIKVYKLQRIAKVQTAPIPLKK